MTDDPFEQLLNRDIATDVVVFALNTADARRLDVARADVTLTGEQLRQAREDLEPDIPEGATDEEKASIQAAFDADVAMVAELAEKAKAELAEVEKSIPLVRWSLRSVGDAVYEELIGRFPPTAEQIDAAMEADARFIPLADRTKLDPAIVAACTTEIDIAGQKLSSVSAEQVARLFKSPGWVRADIRHLVERALALDERRRSSLVEASENLGKG